MPKDARICPHNRRVRRFVLYRGGLYQSVKNLRLDSDYGNQEKRVLRLRDRRTLWEDIGEDKDHLPPVPRQAKQQAR